MVNITKLFTIAAYGATAASALHLSFQRYSDKTCNPVNKLRKNTDLDDGHCKTFDDDNAVFHSFHFQPGPKHLPQWDKKDCTLIAYDQKHCKGTGVTYGSEYLLVLSLITFVLTILIGADIRGLEDRCLAVDLDGRSIKFDCVKRAKPNTDVVRTSTLPPRPEVKAVTITDEPTATITHTHVFEPETLTLVPKKQGHRHCYYDDDDQDW